MSPYIRQQFSDLHLLLQLMQQLTSPARGRGAALATLDAHDGAAEILDATAQLQLDA